MGPMQIAVGHLSRPLDNINKGPRLRDPFLLAWTSNGGTGGSCHYNNCRAKVWEAPVLDALNVQNSQQNAK